MSDINKCCQDRVNRAMVSETDLGDGRIRLDERCTICNRYHYVLVKILQDK